MKIEVTEISDRVITVIFFCCCLAAILIALIVMHYITKTAVG